MEEILRDLIINSSSSTSSSSIARGKTVSLSKPCCYFNLSSSKRNWNYEPSSLYISKLYQKCMKSLKNSYKIYGGFSSFRSQVPNRFPEEEDILKRRVIIKDNISGSDNKSSSGYSSPEVPSSPLESEGEEREIFTSILALDILANLSSGGYSKDDSEIESESEPDREKDGERSVSCSSKYSGSNSPVSKTDNYFTIDDLYEIAEFITPSSGLTNFSLYKKMRENYIGKNLTPEISEEENEEDEDNDNDKSSIESIEVLESNNFMITALAISILLETGNLHPEPAKMVAKILKADMLRRFEEFLEVQIQLLDSSDSNVIEDKEGETDTNGDMDIDPIECCNLMRLLYQLDLSDGTEDIQDFLYEFLEQKLYLSTFTSTNTNTHANGTENINGMEFSPDAFLYFLTRAVTASRSSKAEEMFRDLLCERILERLGVGCGFDFNLSTPINNKKTQNENFFSSLYIGNLEQGENSNNNSSDEETSTVSKITQYHTNHSSNNNNNGNNTRNVSSLNLALRILCFHELGLLDKKSVKSSVLAGEMRVLLKSQSVLDEGCWPADSICKLNPATYFGGSQLTNVFVLKVLSVFKI